MSSFCQKVFSIIFIAALISNIYLVEGGLIPKIHEAPRRRNTTSTAVEITGLAVLKSYVCSPCINTVKRQTANNVTTKIDVPVADIPELATELLAILAEIERSMKAKGIPVPLSGPTSTAAVNQRRENLDISEVSALPLLKTYVCPQCSNMTRRQAVNYTTTLSSISPSDLLALYQQILSLLEQLIAVINAQGITFTISPGSTTVATPGSSTVHTGSFPTVATTGGTTTISITTTVGNSVNSLDASSTSMEPTHCQTISTIYITVSTVATGTAAAQSTTTLAASVAATSTTATQNTGSGGVFIATSVGSSSSTSNFASQASSSTSGYVFNAQSSKNIAVYFGQTAITGSSSLVAQCADPDIDIVILAFVIARNFNGGMYPQVNFGAACGGQTSAMAAQAPGLLYCPILAANILSCQQTYGKKVFLSIGGATAGVWFNSASDAVDFGNILWQLFGPSGNIDPGLRPFGNVVIDGFDVDNENNLPSHYEILASTLRTAYLTDTSKSYYLSSAPQCPFPDASDPQAMLLLCDFVFVQFYNNPPCEIGTTGFIPSVQQWSSAMAASTRNPKPMVYVGAPAWGQAGPSAYSHIGSPSGMQPVAHSVKSLGLANFGGVMFWDGPEGMANVEGGKDIISWAKAGLVA